MKNKLILALLVSGSFFFTSCSSDDDGSSTSNTTATEVVQTVSSGTWRITNYVDSGNDETNDFAGYDFTFTSSNNTVVATNGTDSYTGAWSVTNSSDDDSSNDVDFDLIFTAPSPNHFLDLTDDWDIQERTATRIKLVDVSGGNGGTDYLTFEKN